MQLQERLSAIPPREWITNQAVIFDWYDGPRSGACRLANPEGEFLFDLLDERHNPDGLDDRLFRLREIPDGTMERILTALRELGHPDNAVWVPVWKFTNPTNRQNAEELLQEIESTARALPIVIASRDLEHFQGCWSTKNTNGDAADWFRALGVPVLPGV